MRDIPSPWEAFQWKNGPALRDCVRRRQKLLTEPGAEVCLLAPRWGSQLDGFVGRSRERIVTVELACIKAVIDGYLVDYEPPIQITTELPASGIQWKAGEELKVYDVLLADPDGLLLGRSFDEIDLDRIDGPRPSATLYPRGLNADQLVQVIEGEIVWRVIG